MASFVSARHVYGVSLGGFITTEQPAARAWSNLSGNHGCRKVPWCNDTTHADGLFQRKEGGVGSRRRNGDTICSGCFLGKPRYEARGIDNFSFCLRVGLAIFQAENSRNFRHLVK